MPNAKCITCSHYHAASFPQVCTLIQCRCDEKTFVAKSKDYDEEHYHMKLLMGLDENEEKVRYILLNIPNTRNLTAWKFWLLYLHYVINFAPGMEFTVRIAHDIEKNHLTPINIDRIKRNICQPEMDQLREYQDQLLDIEAHCKKTNENLPMNYYTIQGQIKSFIRDSQFIPTDYELLKYKGIKAETIKEWCQDKLSQNTLA